MSQKDIASDSLIKDDMIQVGVAAERYRPSLWNLSRIAWNGRGGGPELGTEQTRMVTPDGSLAAVLGVTVRQGDEVAARETLDTTGPWVSHSDGSHRGESCNHDKGHH